MQFDVSTSPYGPQDEIGRLNEMTPASRQRVLARHGVRSLHGVLPGHAQLGSRGGPTVSNLDDAYARGQSTIRCRSRLRSTSMSPTRAMPSRCTRTADPHRYPEPLRSIYSSFEVKMVKHLTNSPLLALLAMTDLRPLARASRPARTHSGDERSTGNENTRSKLRGIRRCLRPANQRFADLRIKRSKLRESDPQRLKEAYVTNGVSILHSILKFFQVDNVGMLRMTSSARYFKEGVGSRRPNWRWIRCFLEWPKANTWCKACVKRCSCS